MSNEARARSKKKVVKRAPNYSVNEKRFLVDRILNSYPVILDKRVDNWTKREKSRAWELLAAEFNNQGGFNNRNPTTLRTCWENLKRLMKNECVTSVLEPHLTPKKQNSIQECEVIDLEEPNETEKCEENDTKERKMMVEVKIDEDVIFIPDTDVVVENCDQENNVTDQTNNKDPLSGTNENIVMGGIENADCDSVAAAPKVNKEPAEKKKLVKRLHVAKRRPVNLRSAFVRKEIELFQTLKKHAEEHGKTLAMKKIELFEALKLNAEEEGKIKRLILEEQLKQEKIKTVKMESLF